MLYATKSLSVTIVALLQCTLSRTLHITFPLYVTYTHTRTHARLLTRTRPFSKGAIQILRNRKS